MRKSPPFLSLESYDSIFHIRKNPLKLANALKAKLDSLGTFFPSCDSKALKILSLGFGSGMRDLAVIKAIVEASGIKNVEITAVEPFAPGTPKVFGEVFGEFIYSEADKKSTFNEASSELHIVIHWKKSLEEARIKGFQCDIVLALCVLHLLPDWKTALLMILASLKKGGILAISDTPGTISAFDGVFDFSDTRHQEWQAFWQLFYKTRQDLLLPTFKRISPGRFEFVHGFLKAAGFTSIIECECRYEGQCLKTDLAVIVHSIKGGADASTLGAIRIPDSIMADALLSAFVSAVEKLPTDLSFEVGHRVFFYQVVDFTEAKTQEALRKECCNSAARDLLPRTSSVKDALSLRTEWPQTAKATREKYALATLLYELRDSLCLSDAAYAVFTTKWDGKYQDNIQLVPKSLLGSLNSESARVVLEQLRHHLDRPQNEHVSVLFAASTSEFSIEVRRRGEQPNVKVLHRNDGVPYHLICDIPDSFFPKLSEAEPAVPQNHATPRYHFDQQGGFSSFFFEFDPDTLLRVSQNDQQRSSKDINGDHQNSISKVVSKALGSCFTGAATQVVIKAVMNCVRCGILKLNGGEGAWTTCFYIRNRSQGEPHFPRRTASGD